VRSPNILIEGGQGDRLLNNIIQDYISKWIIDIIAINKNKEAGNDSK